MFSLKTINELCAWVNGSCLTLFIIACLTHINGIVVNKYCRDKDRLITSEENDDYLLVTAESNTTIILTCGYW